MMITTTNFGALMGAPVLGPDDEKIGTVGQVFVDPTNGRPNWMTVHTGWFGRSESFVPLDTAEWDHERVHIQYGKEFIKEAPRIDTDGALGQNEEDELYRYYGMSHAEDGDRASGVGSDDPSGGSPSAYMDTERGPNSQRPTGSDYGHTGVAHVGAHVADSEPDRQTQADAGTDAEADARSDADTDEPMEREPVERPSRRMRRFVVTEMYVEDDGSLSEAGGGASERVDGDQPGDR
jgi:hypothetical protein